MIVRTSSSSTPTIYGESLLPLFRDPTLPEYSIHDEMFWSFNQTSRGLVKGDWKIVSISDGPWRLYNVKSDPAESKNLAVDLSEVLRSMSDHWYAFATNRTTMPPSWRAPLKQYQEGWGFHRIRMVMPSFVRASRQDGGPSHVRRTQEGSARPRLANQGGP